jgi:hypothetical protein
MDNKQKGKVVTGVVAGAAGMFFFPTITIVGLAAWSGYEAYKAYQKKNG